MTVTPFDPAARRALAALDALPPQTALGFHRTDHGPGGPVYPADVRAQLLAGNLDPAAVLRTVGLVKWSRNGGHGNPSAYTARETGEL